MHSDQLLADLQARGLLPPEQAAAIAQHERARPFSLHQELRAALYLGITLLTGGLGVLLYQHLDEIGHGVIIGGMALLMLASFGYVARHRQPFTWGQAAAPSFVPDYALLLGCLLFLALETYLQVQYNVFGSRYGLATILPGVLFFGLAYRFDHRGVLAMGITALASWVGVSIAPVSAFTDNNFFTTRLGGMAVLLGLALTGVGLHADLSRRKPHFAFTYISLGSNLALLAATAALFDFYPQPFLPKVVMVPLILALSAALMWYARRTKSYLFLLMGVLYGYLTASYLFFRLLSKAGEAAVLIVMLYLMLSAVGIILLFVNGKKFLRRT
ncbi:DUF2157 domain-containing protein [Hymenobacter psychrotolerans]|uniref:Predicted membrane protein n=1 Tax=Hymenobacter psychrotolerans DSM 18569 TaxID=1121959 RepID=A0A1M6NZZ2_9BACT|nr:DUF2157 domain-containing protein [Hymenobacter psychrotolerans]SHK01213.1 Predicted membrane protein [Hymenobacter psychrotolerans DSM 18569]